MVAREPPAGTAETGHHFVEDEQDPVAVAHLADRAQVALRRHDDAVRARDRLEDDGSDSLRVLVGEHLLEVRSARADRARIGVARRTAVLVRIQEPDDPRDPRLGGPAPSVAGQRGGSRGRAVVGAIARDHLLAARVPARELDRALVRLRTAVREERPRQVARRHLGEESGELAAGVVRELRADRAEPLSLLLDRGHEPRVLVPDVQADRLGAEVEIPLPVVVPETTALAARHRDRVELRLDRPGMEDVSAVVRKRPSAAASVG